MRISPSAADRAQKVEEDAHRKARLALGTELEANKRAQAELIRRQREVGPFAVTRSISGMRRPSSGCPSPKS